MQAGTRFTFRKAYHRAKYGGGGTITQVQTTVDRPHPGRVHRDWIDATTDNGTKIQWQRGEFTRAVRIEEVGR